MDETTELAKIDKDYISCTDMQEAVGVTWTKQSIESAIIRPYGIPFASFDGVNVDESKKIRFRCLDDDDIPFYGGWLYNDDECVTQSAILAWAEGAGCTTIEIKVDESWVREIG